MQEDEGITGTAKGKREDQHLRKKEVMETMRMMKMREVGVMRMRMMKAMMKTIVVLPVKGVARRRRVKFLAETVLMMRN